MLKRLALLLFLALILLSAVVLLRTLSLRSLQPQVEPIALLRLDESALLERLAGAITHRTVTTKEGQGDSAAFRDLHGFLRESFPGVHAALATETVNDWSLLFTWEGADPVLEPMLLMGHLDVVPVDPRTLEDWDAPPFAGAISNGYLYGRGSLDDKVGVLAILEAVERLLADGFRPQRTVLLAFGHDEEGGGAEGGGALRDLLVSRGVDSFAMVLDEGGVIAEGMSPGIDDPVALVGIAEKGSVTLTLTVEGPGGHSSAPPKRTNIGRLARAIARLEDDPFPHRFGGVLTRMFEFLGPEMPFFQRMACANLWLFGGLIEAELQASPEALAMLHTTTAATLVEGGFKNNVLPSSARAVLNFRILPGESPETVAARVRSIIDDPEVRVSGEQDGRSPSPVSDPYSGAFHLLGRTIREVFGSDVQVAPYLVVAGTDASYYAGLSNRVFRFLPIRFAAGDLNRIHGTNERIGTDGYLTCVRFFHRLIQKSGELP